MNEDDNPKQKEFEGTKQWHQWMGELMFSTKLDGSKTWETQNGKFGPDEYLTREQLAVMLYRYAVCAAIITRFMKQFK